MLLRIDKRQWNCIVIFDRWWFFLLIIHPICSQHSFQTLIIKSNPGLQYLPVNTSAQFISANLVNSYKACAQACNLHTLCGVFDYNVNQPKECRLFEGDLITLGTVIPSSSSQSMVGNAYLSIDLFAAHGQPCSFQGPHSRYLQCGSNRTYECMSHMYWDSSVSICYSQSSLRGASCQPNMNMCRADLYHICLQYYQCGPKSLLTGRTIANSSTIMDDNSTVGYFTPAGMAIVPSVNGSLIVADSTGFRIILLAGMETNQTTASSLIHYWNSSSFGELQSPGYVYLDTRHGNNLYVSDAGLNQVVLFWGMQSTSPLPTVVAGTPGYYGSDLNKFNQPAGVALDNLGNLIVADRYNHRIMYWPVNATKGIMLAGSGTNGSGSYQLNCPSGIFFDEHDLKVYVADRNNYRIVRFAMNDVYPRILSTVAGGNGYGVSSNQLASPIDVRLSKKTKDIYVTEYFASRIQRWSPGADRGVTIAGTLDGVYGYDSTSLRSPNSIVIDEHETIIYISERGGSRIVRFDLI